MSNNFGYPTLTTSQTAKEATINTALGQIDAALSEDFDISLASTDTAITPTLAQLRDNMLIKLTPDGVSPPISSQEIDINISASLKKMLVFKNECVCSVAVTGTSSVVVVKGNSTVTIFCNLGDIIAVGTGSVVPTAVYVHAATKENVVIATGLNNGDTVGGAVVTTGQFVLLAGQTVLSENGIYVVGPSPVRASFASVTGQIVPNMLIQILGGRYATSFGVCENVVPPVIGSDSIVFAIAEELNPVSIGFFIPGEPTESATVWRFVVTEDIFTIYDDFAGTKVMVGTNPSSTIVLDVKLNGGTIGTISINSSGVATLTTTTASPVYLAEDDYLDVVTPVALNGLADLSVTFRGYR